jgi:hypothetical protein
MLSHHVCENCGHYKGKQVLDVHAAMHKKEAKRKKKDQLSGEKSAEEKK